MYISFNMSTFSTIFDDNGGSEITTMDFITSENIISVFTKNQSRSSVSLILQTIIEFGNTTEYIDVWTPDGANLITITIANNTSAVNFLSGVPINVKFRFRSLAAVNNGSLIIKVTK